jgi:hypothetical protein
MLLTEKIAWRKWGAIVFSDFSRKTRMRLQEPVVKVENAEYPSLRG